VQEVAAWIHGIDAKGGDPRIDMAECLHKTPYKSEFLQALGTLAQAYSGGARKAVRERPARAANYMRLLSEKMAVIASVDLHESDSDLRAVPLADWVGTIDWPSMVPHADRPVWMDHAAVFSFLSCTDSELRSGRWDSVPHPEWLQTRRTQLEPLRPRVEEVASAVESATMLAPPLSRVTAEYVVIRHWDDFVRVLTETANDQVPGSL